MIRGSSKTEAEYRAVQMDSSSSLKEFSIDRKKYYKKYVLNERVEDEEESKAATIGRVVETLLLEPDEFDKRFFMSSCAKPPTGKMLEFVLALNRHSLNAKEETTFKEIALQAHKDSGFDWGFDVVLKKFIGSDAEIYFKELKEVSSKKLTVVAGDEVTNAERIVQELKTNETTAEIVNLESNGDFEVHNQIQIEGYEVLDMPFKSMMDKVIIDHKKKTIQCYDLKCVWAVENFFEEYYLYRRAYIQAYLYKEACAHLKDELDLEYYTVENPRFLVCDSINYYHPLIYVLNNSDMADAYKGFEWKGRSYPGVEEIIKDLKWAKKENIWNISRTNCLNGGIASLK